MLEACALPIRFPPETESPQPYGVTPGVAQQESLGARVSCHLCLRDVAAFLWELNHHKVSLTFLLQLLSVGACVQAWCRVQQQPADS